MARRRPSYAPLPWCELPGDGRAVIADISAFLFAHATTVQALLFGSVIVVCWGCENAWFTLDRGRRRRRAAVNGLFAALALPVQVAMTAICVLLAGEVARREWGLAFLVPGHESVWVKFVLMFVVLDFLDYVYHVAMHHVPMFWRVHLVHHTDQAIDASTTVREHPGETVVRNGFLMVWVVLCGASLEILVIRQTFETVANILAHSSFRLRPRTARLMGAVLVTPNLHHVHHHNALPYTNRNYGDVFSVWDRLFGTFATLARADTVFGLDSHPSASDPRFVQALLLPFATAQAAAAPSTGTRTGV